MEGTGTNDWHRGRWELAESSRGFRARWGLLGRVVYAKHSAAPRCHYSSGATLTLLVPRASSIEHALAFRASRAYRVPLFPGRICSYRGFVRDSKNRSNGVDWFLTARLRYRLLLGSPLFLLVAWMRGDFRVDSRVFVVDLYGCCIVLNYVLEMFVVKFRRISWSLHGRKLTIEIYVYNNPLSCELELKTLAFFQVTFTEMTLGDYPVTSWFVFWKSCYSLQTPVGCSICHH